MPAGAGRGGVPFPPQPGMVMPGQPGNRAGNFPGAFPPQQMGRGGPNPGQQMPSNMYGLPGQPGMPPQALQGGASAYGAPNAAYAAALAQAQAAAQATGGRGGPGGRGPLPGMPGLPPNMAGLQGVRGMPGAGPGFPAAGGRGQMPGIRGGQMGAYSGPAGRGQLPGQMVPQPGMGAGAMPQDAAASVGLTSQALSSAPPQQQKQMLGEALYPKINAQQPELAGKITGMLLEMDNTELLNL